MSHILSDHNGLKNTIPLWIQPVSFYSLTGSSARVSPGRQIAPHPLVPPGMDRASAGLQSHRPPRRCWLRPSVRSSGCSAACCSEVRCSARSPGGVKRCWAGGRGERGFTRGTTGKRPGMQTCSSCHRKAQPLNSGVAGVRLLGKMRPYQVHGVYLTALEYKTCFLVNKRSVAAEGCDAEVFCSK